MFNGKMKALTFSYDDGVKQDVRLIEILMRESDASHGLSMPEIISALAEYGITAERKSIYDDIITLGEMGFDVITLPTRPPKYTLASRHFEISELKMLADAVASSKFITAEKSRNRIAQGLPTLKEIYKELIDKNPFNKIQVKFREPTILPKTIPLQIVETFLSTIYTQRSIAPTSYQKRNALRDAAVIELLFATGIRITELCSLKEFDINLYEKTDQISC